MSNTRWTEPEPESSRDTGVPPPRAKGFAMPATDSQLLRQFAADYDQYRRSITVRLPTSNLHEPETQTWRWALLGVGLFVLLLAAAMGLAIVLPHVAH